MTTLAKLEALLGADDQELAALRKCLQRMEFDDTVLSHGESIAPGLVDALRLPLVHAYLLGSGKIPLLAAALWLYRATLNDNEAAMLLLAEERELLLRLGLITRENGQGLRAAVRITPFDGLLIVADDVASAREAVMSPSTTTLSLSRLLGDVHGLCVLDFGCGPGTIALLAAQRGAQPCSGSDLSPRAIDLARFNARLNQLDVEFVVSDLFAALNGRRFDRIFAQPPYVLQPPTTAHAPFMHAGPRGDTVLRPLFAHTIEHLTDRGRAVYSFHLPLGADDMPLSVIEAWLGTAPVDLALWTNGAPSPAVQAIAYSSMHAANFDRDYAEEVQNYAAHLNRLHITHFVNCCAVVLGQRDDEPRRFHGSLRRDPGQVADVAWLEPTLQAWQAASAPLPQLANLPLQAASGLVIAEETTLGATGESQWHARFPAHSPFFDCELSPASAALLRLFDHPLTLRQAVEAYAQLCEASPREVAQQVVDFVRHGLVRGLFVVAPGAPLPR